MEDTNFNISNCFFTVVVAAFNSGKWINKCLESIKNQEFNNFECIIIDNRSSDNTVSIARRYCNEDKRFRLFCNDKNYGVSYSRNVGIDNASGKWLTIIDSDDYVERGHLQMLYEHLDDECILLKYNSPYVGEYSLDDPVCYNPNALDLGFANTCVFNVELLHKKNIRYRRCSICEDTILAFEYALCCDKIRVIGTTLYNSCGQNPDSLSKHCFKDPCVFDEMVNRICDVVHEHENRNDDKFDRNRNKFVYFFLHFVPHMHREYAEKLYNLIKKY